VVQGDWKLIVPLRRTGAAELYNLAEDPAEKSNRVATNPVIVEELREHLAKRKSSICLSCPESRSCEGVGPLRGKVVCQREK
jgi:hypothetical protein